MPVSPRGGSFQAAFVHQGTRYRRQFATRQEAELWELESKASILRGMPVYLGEQAKGDGKPRTLGELVAYCVDNRWKRQKSAKTSKTNAEDISSRLGYGLHPKLVDQFRLDKVVREMEKDGLSNGTINRKLAALSVLLKTAASLQVIDRAPSISFLRETGSRRFRFTPEIERKVMGWFERTSNQDMLDYVALSLDTGGRQSEILRLRWDDVSDARMVRFYDRKSGRSSGVPMTSRVKALLLRRFEERPLEGDLDLQLVFPAQTADTVQWAWKRMRQALRLDDEPSFVPHILRHEFCSRLADGGANAATIMALADHSNLTTSQRYINLSPVSLEDAMIALEPISNRGGMWQGRGNYPSP